MGPMASQITSLMIHSIVPSGVDQRKHQSSASLAFVRGIHRRPANSPHKWPVTRKLFPFDDVIMLDKHVMDMQHTAHQCDCLTHQIRIKPDWEVLFPHFCRSFLQNHTVRKPTIPCNKEIYKVYGIAPRYTLKSQGNVISAPVQQFLRRKKIVMSRQQPGHISVLIARSNANTAIFWSDDLCGNITNNDNNKVHIFAESHHMIFRCMCSVLLRLLPVQSQNLACPHDSLWSSLIAHHGASPDITVNNKDEIASVKCVLREATNHTQMSIFLQLHQRVSIRNYDVTELIMTDLSLS